MKVAIPDLISPSYFPAIAAVELGCFKEQGVDASLELLYPVTKTYEELRDGRLDFVGGAAHAVLYAFRASSDEVVAWSIWTSYFCIELSDSPSF